MQRAKFSDDYLTRSILSTPNKEPDHDSIRVCIGTFWWRTLRIFAHDHVKGLLHGVSDRFVSPGATLIEQQGSMRRHFPNWTTCALYWRSNEYPRCSLT